MPKAEKVSLIINSICKELGINYCSVNPHYITLTEDAQKMSKIYLQLKEMLGIIKEIEDRHEINGLRENFEKIIAELDEADHLLIKVAIELVKKYKEND
jgi:soluble cytochrome b562